MFPRHIVRAQADDVRRPSPEGDEQASGGRAFARERYGAGGASFAWPRWSGPQAGATRAARWGLSTVFIGLLAACGAGTGDGTADESGSGSPGASVAAACTTAPASFAAVWKDVSGTCATCHAQGRVAGGTNLVFVAAGTDIQNYNILRDYAKSKSDLLLSKSIGLPAHAGGKPYGDANTQQYKDMAALVPEMAAQVCQTAAANPAPGTGAAGGGYWGGVQYVPDATVVAKAAVLFAGRNPTAGEISAAAGGNAAMRQTIRGYMQGPVFDRFLNDVGDTHFLTPGVVVRGNNMGLNAADWPTAGAVLGAQGVTQVANAVRTRFDNSVRREPIELMKYIVKNDRPYTDMVAGNYTVVNGVMNQFLGATVQGAFTNVDDDTEWRQATLPSARLGGTREHAGALSTHAWLQRVATTPTNRNRHRVNVMFKQFLATDVSALAVRPLDDGVSFKVPTVENPACAVCHDVIDPIAAGFQNWNEANRYLPQRTNNVDHALPANYRNASYPKDANNQAYYQPGDNWFRDGKAPGYGATPMPGGFTGNPTALQWLGQQVAADSRFALGAVHFWYEGLFGRAPLKAPFDQTSTQFAALQAAYTAQNDEFKAIAARFASNQGNGAYNVKDLLVDLVMSQWYRADKVTALNATRAVELADVGSANMLPPSQLNQKLIGLVGQGWSEFDNPYAGFALNYGDFDGNQRIVRAKSHTMMQSVAIDRLVAVRSCTFAMTDFNKPVAERLLFPAVALTDLPNTATGLDAITQNVRHLHKALWKDDVPATDAEVQRTVKLFTDIWNDRATAPARPVNCSYNNGNDANYTGRAWAAVLAYMLGDPKFLYE
jgi:hypothetical protein